MTHFAEQNYKTILCVFLAVSAAFRVYLAMNSVYLYDEHRDWIRTAVEVISFDPEALYLPIRTEWHNAFVAYLIKIGSIFGDGSHLSYRWTSVLGGVLTVAAVAAIAKRFAGLHVSHFVGVFLFFTLMNTTNNYVLWFWVLAIMVPGAVLAGGAIAVERGWIRIGIMSLVAGGAVWSVVGLVVTNHGMPRIYGHTHPSPVHAEPGTMADITVHFDICDLCDPSPDLRLSAITYVGEDVLLSGQGHQAQNVLGTSGVLGAEAGTDDRALSVPVPPLPDVDPPTRMHRKYTIIYDLFEDGRQTGFVEADSFVAVNPAEFFLPIFWIDE